MATLQLDLPDDFSLAGAKVPEDFKRELFQITRKAFEDAGARYTVAEFCDRRRMAQFLGCSENYVDILTRKGMPVIVVDGHRMWCKADACNWLDQYHQ